MRSLSFAECTIAIGALRIAETQYKINAELMKAAGQDHLVRAFRQQAKDAADLANKLGA